MHARRVCSTPSHHALVHAIVCAANHTRGIRPCTHRDDHLPTCPNPNTGLASEVWHASDRPGTCTGCLPRDAVHGYLCRHHYEQVDDALHAHTQLQRLLEHGERAVTPTSSASTIAGPRIPLAALRLDLDHIARLHEGRGSTSAATWVISLPGAMQALRYAHAVHQAARRHPVEPRTERLHRVRCASCRQVSVVTDPPAIAGGDSTLRCVSCGWHSRDQEYAEAAAYTEALVRDPYRARRRTATVRKGPGGLEQLAGIAKLAKALAS